MLNWPDAKVKHVVQAIGSSSVQKGEDFAKKYCQANSPRIYGSYNGVYYDGDVDIVYIGTPHGYHYRDCMEAIAAGKNVLCEKSFTINAKQAKEIFAAAKDKNVYIAEAMWLRHRPLVRDLERLLHEEKIIGEVLRASCDFASGVDVAALPPTSRYRDLTLGAGSLLDVGIYSLTWVTLALKGDASKTREKPRILASQTHEEGIEVTTSAILQFPSTGRQGVSTCTTKTLSAPGEVFAVIHGTDGYIEIEGKTPSIYQSFTVWKRRAPGDPERCLFPRDDFQAKKYDFSTPGLGFMWEAENTAFDVLAGRKESRIMPWSETVYIMEILDEIRRQGKTVYPGEEED